MIRNKGVFKQYGFLILFLAFSIGITFSQTNNPPVAVYDVATADQNTTLDVSIIDPGNTDNYVYTSLLDNDSDPDGDLITIIRFTVDGGVTWFDVVGSGTTATAILSGTVTGEITIFPDGTYTFVPANNYTGFVPNIMYEISDGMDTATAILYLTVETDASIIEIKSINSCNQGYTTDGKYKIRYDITVENISNTRGYHQYSEVENIQLFNDLEYVFGDTCIDEIQRIVIGASRKNDFIGGEYPIEFDPFSWDVTEFSESNDSPGDDGIFNAQIVDESVLYPGQTIGITYCVMVNPDCHGRPYPANVGDGVDFENEVTLTSNRGNDSDQVKITNFHTPETTVSANLYLNDELVNGIFEPVVHPDATFVYSHKVIITNDGSATADNVNFNLGLKNFIDKGVDFVYTTVSEVTSGVPLAPINVNYNGLNESLLLLPGYSLNAGESVILKIDFKVNPLTSEGKSLLYSQLITSMTYGVEDGQGDPPAYINEAVDPNNKIYSYVIWEDSMGYHLDRYYSTTDDTAIPSSDNQCKCDLLGVRLLYNLRAVLNKTSTVIDESPGGVEEFQEVTFEFTFTNTTLVLELIKIQIQDDLTSICDGNHVVSVSLPQITESTATQDPIINNGFDGVTDINIFDGNTGILLAEDPNIPAAAEYFKVKFNVVFVEDCDGENTLDFSAWDDGERNILVGENSYLDTDNNTVPHAIVNLSSDYDSDGITNVNDIDDDNDGIPDLLEYGNVDPLEDSDGDLIPNYRDTTATNDSNGDGIVDSFDFDLDGVPNHFDLDSDNDGITDIIEAGGIDTDNNGLVPVNADGTLVLDLDNDGLTDSLLVDTNNDGVADIPVDVDVASGVLIPNLDSDGDTHVNALDIDSDNDGIVDNIEAQVSNMNTQVSSDIYLTPNSPDLLGLVYTDGLIPIDTDGDIIPDYLDTDSDDDTRADVIEGWDTDNDGIVETNALGTDTDNDGLDDAYDVNSLTINSLYNSSNNNQVPTYFPNVDNSSTPELDWREIPAIVVIISNESEIEGNDLNFTISLVSLGSYIDNTLTPSLPLIPKASTTEVKIELYTSDGDGTDPTDQYDVAKENFDYIPIIQLATEIIIPAGDTSYTFTMDSSGNNVIKTIDDTIDELNEHFTLNGYIITENTINQTSYNPDTYEIEKNFITKGIGTIIDNDAAPDLIMNDDTKDEGDPLIHIVQIDNSTNPTTASSRPIDIKITVTDQTAIHPDDYTNTSPDTVTIPATDDPNNPNTAVEYSITTILDLINEPDDETISVVGEVVAGSVGNVDLDKIGTIVDKDPPPKVIISNPTVVEGDILEFTISLVHPATNEPLAHYEDILIRVFTSNGTAREPGDYLPVGLDVPMDITIPATVFNTKIQVVTNDDKLVEDVEDLTLFGKVLSFNTNNIDAEGLGTIIDNDLPNLFSPNDDGFSDVFEVVHLLQYLNFKLQIFDRWGSEVYNYSNNGNPSPEWWDGTIKGNPVPEGVYYYTVDYNDGKTKPISGFIQLIR